MHWKVKTKSGTIFNPGLALIDLSWTPGLVVLSCSCLWLSSICVKRILWIPFLPSHRWGFPNPVDGQEVQKKCNKNNPARLKSDFDTLKQFASMQDVSWQPRPQGAFLWLFFWHIYNRFQSWIAFKSQYPHTNSPVLDCKQSLFFFRFSEGSAQEERGQQTACSLLQTGLHTLP